MRELSSTSEVSCGRHVLGVEGGCGGLGGSGDDNGRLSNGEECAGVGICSGLGEVGYGVGIDVWDQRHMDYKFLERILLNC